MNSQNTKPTSEQSSEFKRSVRDVQRRSGASEELLLQLALRLVIVAGVESSDAKHNWQRLQLSNTPRVELRSALETLSREHHDLAQLADHGAYDQLADNLLRHLIALIEQWSEKLSWLNLFEALLELPAESRTMQAESSLPPGVIELLVRLASPQKSSDIADLYARNGRLLIQTAVALGESNSSSSHSKLVGFERNAATRALASAYAKLAGHLDTEFRQATHSVAPLQECGDKRPQFDTVFACPPFGLRVELLGYERNAFPFGITKAGDLLALQDALLALKPGGTALVLMPLGALFRGGAEGKIREGLLNADLIETVIQLAPRLLYSTGIPVCIVVGRGHGAKSEERKGRVLCVDATSYTEKTRPRNTLGLRSIAAIVELANNFEDVPGKSVIRTCSELTQAGSVIAPSKYFSEDRYDERLREQFGGQVIRLGDLFSFRLRSKDKSPKALLPGASLYVRRTNPIASTEEPVPKKTNPWYILDAVAEEASAQYYCHFLNSELGLQGMLSQSHGGNVAQLSREGLANLLVPAPNPGYQERFLQLHRRIDDVATTARELRFKLDNEPKQFDAIEQSLSALDTGDSMARWAMTLPFPLATVLRRYQTTVDPREKQDFGIRFLEAFVQFVAMYDLSCFHEATHVASVGTLLPGLDKKRLLSAGGIGSWHFVHEKLAMMLRKGKHLSELREVINPRFVDGLIQLASEEIGKAFHRAVQIKNSFKSHDAVADDTEYRRQISAIDSEIQVFREHTVGLFESLKLVRPLSSTKTAGIRRVTVEELQGSDQIFNRAILVSDYELDSSLLYAVAAGVTQPLPLIPLITMRSSPKFAHDACYFFSRIDREVQWVSYHYHQEPRLQDDGGGLPAAMNDLFPEDVP